MFRRALPLFAMLAACTGTPDPVLSFEIVSPEANASFDQGHSVHLEGVAMLDEVEVDAQVVWTAGEWTATGNPIDVSDLPVGMLELGVVATYEELSTSTVVSIEVVPGPVDYAGSLSAKADVSSTMMSQTFDCVSDYLDFTVQPDGSFAGEGACTLDLPIVGPRTEVFTITGTVSGDVVSGSMSVSEAPDQPTSFSGSKGTDGAITANFDQTFTSSNGSLRLYGSFTATPAAL